MMQLQLAAQQQQQQQQSGSSAVGTAQELYANGYQDLAATTSATKQMASTRDRPSGTEFRLDTTLVVFRVLVVLQDLGYCFVFQAIYLLR